MVKFTRFSPANKMIRPYNQVEILNLERDFIKRPKMDIEDPE
jgi:hypothetical protein